MFLDKINKHVLKNVKSVYANILKFLVNITAHFRFINPRNFHHPCIYSTYEKKPPLAPYNPCYFKMGEVSAIGTLPHPVISI